MQWRKLLLSTVVCSGVLFSGAAAEAGQILLPNSTWAISKITANTPGGAPYCALARRFDGDTILTFARNGLDESSFAVDFKKDILNKTQSYNVKLVSGAGQTRAFDVKPVSSNAIVIRLGKDYAFYDALNRSSRLDVDVAGTSYEFDITKFDDGQKKLNGCLITLTGDIDAQVAAIEPAAGDDGSPAVTAGRRGEVSSEDLLANAHTKPQAAATSARELEALREENTRLRNALEMERRNFEDKFSQGSEDSNRAAELNEKIKILEKENSDLHGQLGAQPESPAPQACAAQDPAATAALAKNLAALEDENADLKKQVASLGAESKSAANTTTAIDTLRAENEKLSGDLESERAKLKFMQGELDTSHRDLESVNNASSADNSALSSLKEKVRSLESENATLEQQVASLSRQPVPAAQSQDCSEKTHEAAAASQEIIDRLQAQVDSLKTENDQLRGSLRIAEDKAAQAGEGMISAAQLRAVEDALHAAEAERDSLSRQLETVGNNSDTGIPGIASSDWNLEKATRRYNEAEREIRRLATELQSQRGECKAEKKNIEYMLFDPKITDQQQISKLNNLERELAEKDRQLASLQPAAGSARSSSSSRFDDMPPVARYKVPPVKAENLDDVSASGEFTAHGDEMFARALADISPAAGEPVSNPAPVPPPVASYPVAAVVPQSTGNQHLDAAGIKSLLDRAGITIKGDVKKAGDRDGIKAFTWQTDQIFGSAEIANIASPADFDKASSAYLEKTKGRCTGEFAAVPGQTGQAGDLRVASYEIACVGKEASSSVSILFFSSNGVFTTIAHEANVESMDMAMDLRDRIAGQLLPAKLAAN